MSSGTLRVAVTNRLSGAPVANVAVTLDPPVATGLATDGAGRLALEVPVGRYEVALAKDGFAAPVRTVSVVAGAEALIDVALDPLRPVLVDAGPDLTAAPEGSVALRASAETFDGSAVVSWAWTQIGGVATALTGASAASAEATFADVETFKAKLVERLAVPRRIGVLGVNPHALEEARTVTFQVTVTTSSGTWDDTVAVRVALPVAVSPGLANVPVGVPVLAQSGESATYSWSLDRPPGSAAVLDDATSPWPTFVPDVAGVYTLTEDNGAEPAEVLTIYAGEWMGAITALDGAGLPVAGRCFTCHQEDGTPAPLLPEFQGWAGSGHARILSRNIEDPAHHWSTACAGCHAVGHDPAAENGGFDEALLSEGWVVPQPGYAAAYADMLGAAPETAALANVQCDSCHGPSGAAGGISDAHNDMAVRASLDAAVCGTCHGEPPRHGRYSQWQESGHANFELAIRESEENGHCARCHSAQGFLVWLEQGADRGTLIQRIQDPTADPAIVDNATAAELAAMGIVAAKIQPVTCAACHDPHAAGTDSGEPNTATVRVSGETLPLPAGFRAAGVGRGAICITCHNTRNGRHDDTAVLTSYSVPHKAAQGDVLMGENVYFVTPGARGPHSYLADSCATCHLEHAPPPAELSYGGGGTNHTFRASRAICVGCHGGLDGGAVQLAFAAEMQDLERAIATAAIDALNGLGAVRVRAFDPATDLFSSAAGGNSNVVVAVTTGTPDCGAELNRIEAIRVVDNHGQMAFDLDLACPVTITWTDASSTEVTSFQVQLQSLRDDAQALVFPLDANLPRAIWNYLLLQADGSEGVHSPRFAVGVIRATLRQPLR